MVVSEDIESFCEGLDGLSNNYKLVFNCLYRLKGDSVDKSFIRKGKDYLNNGHLRIEKIKIAYDELSNSMHELCEDFVKTVEDIRSADRNDIEELKNDLEDMNNEMVEKNKGLQRIYLYSDKAPCFVYRNNSKSVMDVELVEKYPGSYFYKEYMSNNRTVDGDIFIDCDGDNDELIVKYMKDDESLNDDMKKMNNEKKNKLLDDLSFLELPIKKEVVTKFGHNEDNEMMEVWKNRQALMVNNEYNKDFIELLKNNQLLDTVFKNLNLGHIQYIESQQSFTFSIHLKFYDVIEDYLKNGKKINKELIEANIGNGDEDELINEMKMIGIELSDEEKEELKGCFYQPQFTELSKIIDDMEYDRCLQKWTRCHKWKLLFRASDHEYKAKSFHEFCDDKGPTLVVIKSTSGYIFGGYTTQSWSGGIYHYMRVINRS